jgi:hypothetical protein
MGANYLSGTLKTTRVLVGIHVKGHKGHQAVCVGQRMQGQRFGNREAVQQALGAAARSCGTSRGSVGRGGIQFERI